MVLVNAKDILHSFLFGFGVGRKLPHIPSQEASIHLRV